MVQSARSQAILVSISVVAIILLAHPTDALSSGEPTWPQFRGPGGLGIAPDNQTYPSELDVSRNLLWKREVPKGHSSPCIWGDDIFITACSGKRLETICLDRSSGEIKWRKSVEVETLEKVDSSNSRATPTPACDGERVYVYFGSFGLLAYDMEGNERWRKPLPDPEIWYGSASSPVLADNMVVINCDPGTEAYVLAVDRDTGETVWKQEGQPRRQGWTTPVIWKHGEEVELIVHRTGNVTSYDLKDGHKRWWFDFVKSSMSNCALTPVYAGDTLFVAAVVGRSGDPVNPIELPDFKELLDRHDTDGDGRLIQTEIPDDLSYIYRRGPQSTGVRNSFSQLDTDQDGTLSEAEWDKVALDTKKIAPTQMDALYAIPAGGKDEVNQSQVRWTVNEGIGQIPSPFHYQGRIYLIKHGGNITCYDAETGRKVYSDRVGPRTYYFASPVAADNNVYFCSMNGAVIVVQHGDTFNVLAQNRLHERIYATPALVDGKIYLRTDKSLYAFTRSKDDADQGPRDIVAKVEEDRARTLYEAAADGDIELVRSLIAGGAEVNAKNEWGWTPLYVAVATGKGEIADLLIAHGAHVDVSDTAGETPLRLAVSTGHKDIFRSLIENGADVRVAGADGVTPLHTAAEQGDTDIVALLINRGADVSATNNYGWTPLHSASQRGSKDIAVMLIDKGADVGAKLNNGLTPLHYVSWIGQKDMAELLIEKGADTNAKLNNGLTPLHLASQRGNKDIVAMLAEKGADIDAPDGQGRTPLVIAKQQGHTEVVNILRQHGAKETLYGAVASGDIDEVKRFLSQGANVNAKDEKGRTALQLALNSDEIEVAELLLAHGADVDATDDQTGKALLLSVGGRKERVEFLLSKGADIEAKDGNGLTLLCLMAAYSNQDDYLDIVTLLLDKGANIESRSYGDATPLQAVIAVGRKEAAELLLARGARLDVVSKLHGTAAHLAMAQAKPDMVRWCISKGIAVPPLHLAAYWGEMDTVRSLLGEGTDVNQKDIAQFTPLHCALLGQNGEIMQLLIDKGADIEARNCANQTPLFCACVRGYLEMVKLLTANEADLNARGFRRGELGHGFVDDWSPLHVAAHRGRTDIVQYLLGEGADIHATCSRLDDEGFTPLHLAAWNGNADVVKVLLSQGADANLKTKEGRTALDFARERDHTEVVELLRKQGVKE